tara:strand:- start:262 stop:705 length:444 start_codon:yes stop_codon:yes gene_type:complete
MTLPIKRTAKNKKEYESYSERLKRKVAADKKFEESITDGEMNRSALKALKEVFPKGLGNIVLGTIQSLVDKEGGKARMKRGAKSVDTSSATSQRMDIKEERARKAHNKKFYPKKKKTKAERSNSKFRLSRNIYKKNVRGRKAVGNKD